MNRKLTAVGILVAGLILFGSCKPKQSSYKSVYEAAKEREVQDEKKEKPSTPVYTPKEDDEDEAVYNEQPISKFPETSEPVRKEKITPVYDSDASNLKSYSIVIAAMGMKPNAEELKRKMEGAGYKIILVQNEQGMYRVVIGSFESRGQAASVKNEILSKFIQKGGGDKAALKAQYGIPFDDWWILQRDI